MNNKKFRIQLDICSLCNLNCVACGMRRDSKGIGLGYTHFEQFKKFVDNNINYIQSIEISNNGEPFLNPDVIQILKYAFDNQVIITCKNGTNFNFKNDDIIKAIVDYKVKRIDIAIDGATEETYKKYRRGGDFNLVMSNLQKLVDYKKLKNSPYPEIYWQYIIRSSTENLDEIRLAKDLAAKLGVNIRFKLTWEKTYIPTHTKEIKELTGLTALTRQESTSDDYSPYHKCKTTFFDEKIVFNWNGYWQVCCGSKRVSSLNVFDLGIERLLQSDEYINTKKFLIAQRDYDVLCKKCHVTQNIAELSAYIKDKIQKKYH